MLKNTNYMFKYTFLQYISMNKKLNEFQLHAAEKCVINAEQFLNDAKLLRDKKSFGHAYSLAVLGFEELAKASILVNIFLGTIQEETKEIQKKLENHLQKQVYMWNQITAFIILEWHEIIMKSEFKDKISNIPNKDKKDEKKFEKLILTVAKEISENTKNVEAANISLRLLEVNDINQRLKKNPSFMENRKQEGFYVDINLGSKKIRNEPQTFTLENTKLINTLEGLIFFTKSYVIGLKEAIKQPEWIERVQDIRKFMKQINQYLSE